MSHHIGSLTAYNILDTFSNNDFVNVLNYSSFTNYTIPCFEDMLVQATEENIKIFKEAIGLLKPSGKTQLDQALEMAFNLLAKVTKTTRSHNELPWCTSTRHVDHVVLHLIVRLSGTLFTNTHRFEERSLCLAVVSKTKFAYFFKMSNTEYRSLIKFLFKEGLSPAQVKERLNGEYKAYSPFTAQWKFRWKSLASVERPSKI